MRNAAIGKLWDVEHFVSGSRDALEIWNLNYIMKFVIIFNSPYLKYKIYYRKVGVRPYLTQNSYRYILYFLASRIPSNYGKPNFYEMKNV